MFLRLWSLKGVGINITCHQNPPPGFCQRFCAGGEKGNFEWKNVRRHQGKWGTKVSGTGDTCIDRTVGVSQRIFWQPLVPHHPWTALSPSSSPGPLENWKIVSTWGSHPSTRDFPYPQPLSTGGVLTFSYLPPQISSTWRGRRCRE